mgnify:FL=1|jgi:hypothetical protein|tara:strand:+ start:385 stop:969 length:585 start_codon:yes stop_codon:yes gene_type:complete
MNTIYKIIIGMVLMVSTVYSQTDISFKFGLPLSSAQLLLKEKNIAGKTIVPAVRTGYFHIGLASEEESIGAHIFVPSVGLRTGHKKVTDLRRYWLADVFTVVPFFTGEDSKQVKEEWDDQFDLILGLIGGYGVEYFLSDQFSIGGEASMNLVMNSWKNEYEEQIDWNEYRSVSEDWRLSAGAVFTQFTLNYYFD